MAAEASGSIVTDGDNNNQRQSLQRESYSFFELKVANARLQKILRLFEQRKRAYDFIGYDAPVIDSMMELIVNEVNPIEKLSNLAVEELEHQRSSNLQLILENMELKVQIKDLQFEKAKLCGHIKRISDINLNGSNHLQTLQHEIDVGVNMVDRCQMTSEDRMANDNQEFLLEVLFLFIEQ